MPDVLLLLNAMMLTGLVCGVRAESGLHLRDHMNEDQGLAKPPPK